MFDADGYLKKPYTYALRVIIAAWYLGMLAHAIHQEYRRVQETAHVEPNS